jgi:hypothetical protein
MQSDGQVFPPDRKITIIMNNFDSTFKTDKVKTYFERKCRKSAVACESLDQQIDSEVYKSKIRRGGLYDLTEEEIKIAEGK